MDVRFGEDRRVAVVTAKGDLDLASCARLRSALLEAADASEEVVLDLGQVTFLDSAAIGVVVGAKRRLAAAGTGLRVVNVQDGPLRVLTMLGLGDLLSLGADVPEPRHDDSARATT
jgi:anti-sigma B factor antagonist